MIDRLLREFGTEVPTAALRFFSSRSVAVARNGAMAREGLVTACHRLGYVVKWPMAWRDRGQWQPRRRWLLGHIAEQVNHGRRVGAKDHIHLPPDLFTPTFIHAELSTVFTGGRESRRGISGKAHCICDRF